MAQYTYDPAKLRENGMDKMRFELGDTDTGNGALTSPMCDEEYEAVLEEHTDWKRAKIACLRAIVMKLSYEVDTSVDGLSYSLSQRYERWKKMLEEEEEKLIAAGSAPAVNKSSISGRPYFYGDMHMNTRRF